MIKRLVTTALVTASLMTSALAFEQEGIQKGNSVLGLDLRYTSMEYDGGGSSDMTTLNGSYSYLVTDSIEVGLGFGYSYSDNTTEQTTTTLSPFVQYNFVSVSPTLVPYVGLGVSIFASDNDGTTTDETGISGEGGLKIFISEKTSIVPAIYYDSYDKFSQTGLKVGLQVYF